MYWEGEREREARAASGSDRERSSLASTYDKAQVEKRYGTSQVVDGQIMHCFSESPPTHTVTPTYMYSLSRPVGVAFTAPHGTCTLGLVCWPLTVTPRHPPALAC